MNAPERLSQRHKFRVVIVGLLPRQFREIEGEFPDLDLRQVSSKPGNDATSLYRGADRVIEMAKFISHDHSNQIRASISDPRNVITCRGGFAAIRAELTRLQTQARLLADNRVIALPVRADSPAYQIDFSALRLAKTGEALTYTRPENMPAHVFESEVVSALSYYQREFNIKASHHTSGGKARITVERGANHLERAEEALLELSERVGAARNTKRHWRNVYLESFRTRPNADAAEHSAFADAAMVGWLSLFPKEN